MRVYLVIMDETEEAVRALRFASRRATKTGGAVHILALVPRESFNAFGAVQATIEEEARDRAEMVASSAAGSDPASRSPASTVPAASCGTRDDTIARVS
mgnify:CR=1 FL=1